MYTHILSNGNSDNSNRDYPETRQNNGSTLISGSIGTTTSSNNYPNRNTDQYSGIGAGQTNADINNGSNGFIRVYYHYS